MIIMLLYFFVILHLLKNYRTILIIELCTKCVILVVWLLCYKFNDDRIFQVKE